MWPNKLSYSVLLLVEVAVVAAVMVELCQSATPISDDQQNNESISVSTLPNGIYRIGVAETEAVLTAVPYNATATKTKKKTKKGQKTTTTTTTTTTTESPAKAAIPKLANVAMKPWNNTAAQRWKVVNHRGRFSLLNEALPSNTISVSVVERTGEESGYEEQLETRKWILAKIKTRVGSKMSKGSPAIWTIANSQTNSKCLSRTGKRVNVNTEQLIPCLEKDVNQHWTISRILAA